MGISNWVLAKAVSSRGQLGVVSGSVLDTVFIRRLQDGDSGGHLRRALRHFPVPSIAEAALAKYLKPEGRQPGQPYARLPLFGAKLTQDREDLLVLAHFAEVYLAKEGHGGIVGLNLLEKVQMVTLPSLYGAILAGVSHVLMGAGIPASIPGALDKLSDHLPASLPLDVADRGDESYSVEFDPTRFGLSSRIPLQRPRFFPIVSSATLAKALLKRANGEIDGFVVEGHASGGHNAPPRGEMRLTVRGEPIYGERDIADLEQMRAIGVPFWLAGAYGTREKVQQALAAGAHGVQVGTLFALCDESGLRQDLKREMLERIANGNLDVFNDPLASPTGFPFRVAAIPQTLSCDGTYGSRPRVCDMGYLRVPYRKADGTLGYRCPAEPVEDYEKKGGLASETIGRKCLCNALPANIGLEQVQTNGYEEHPLVTIGADVASIQPLLSRGNFSYTAEEAIRHLLGDVNQTPSCSWITEFASGDLLAGDWLDRHAAENPMTVHEAMCTIRELAAKFGPKPEEYALFYRACVAFSAGRRSGEINNDMHRELMEDMGIAGTRESLMGHVYHKPYGYAGDFEIIDKLYTQHESDHPEVKRWDRCVQSLPSSRSVRNRGPYFASVLSEYVAGRSGSDPLHVTSLGAGPCRDVLHGFTRICQDRHLTNGHTPLRATLVDMDERALAHGEKVLASHAGSCRFVRADVLRYRPEESVDLIWSSGLFDYFTDRLFTQVLRRLLTVVSPGGAIVIGNFSDRFSGNGPMCFGDWNLVVRSPDKLRELAAAAGAMADQVRIEAEPEGLNLFLHIQRSQ